MVIDSLLEALIAFSSLFKFFFAKTLNLRYELSVSSFHSLDMDFSKSSSEPFELSDYFNYVENGASFLPVCNYEFSFFATINKCKLLIYFIFQRFRTQI